MFYGPIWKQDGRPDLWLARTFSTSPLKPLNGIQRNLKGSKISTPLPSLCFSGWSKKKTKLTALASYWLRHFRFSSESTERNSTKLDRKQNLNVFFYYVCVLQTIGKQDSRLACDWLRHLRLLLWNHLKEFNEAWQETRSQLPCQVCVFRADKKNPKMAALASDWLRHFRLLLWNHWTEFNEAWQ